MESYNQTTKKHFKINVYSWHLITIIAVFIINVVCYKLCCFTYSGFTWMILFDCKWSNLLLVNIAIPVIYIVLYDSICWGTWKISGILIVCFSVIYYMFFLEHFDLPLYYIVLAYGGYFIYSILLITFIDKPGGMADALLNTLYPIEDDDTIQLEYGDSNLSILNYYSENIDKYEVLKEQVDYMLTYEITDRESEKTPYDNVITEIEDTGINLCDPEDNPLHSDNVFGDKRERDKDILRYIETSLVADFKADYHRNVRGKERIKNDYNLYSGINVEQMMRKYISEYFEYDMLLKYVMIALYRTPNYRGFSIRFARQFIVQYICCNVCGYKEFFDDLLKLLHENDIYSFTVSCDKERKEKRTGLNE